MYNTITLSLQKCITKMSKHTSETFNYKSSHKHTTSTQTKMYYQGFNVKTNPFTNLLMGFQHGRLVVLKVIGRIWSKTLCQQCVYTLIKI